MHVVCCAHWVLAQFRVIAAGYSRPCGLGRDAAWYRRCGFATETASRRISRADDRVRCNDLLDRLPSKSSGLIRTRGAFVACARRGDHSWARVHHARHHLLGTDERCRAYHARLGFSQRAKSRRRQRYVARCCVAFYLRAQPTVPFCQPFQRSRWIAPGIAGKRTRDAAELSC